MAEVKKRGRPSQPGSGSQKGAQALERGIAVLNYLAQSGGSSSVSNIAENLSLPLSTTFRLLKVLEDRKVRRLGGEREIEVDIQIIAATNRNLQDEIREGHFRADL